MPKGTMPKASVSLVPKSYNGEATKDLKELVKHEAWRV